MVVRREPADRAPRRAPTPQVLHRDPWLLRFDSFLTRDEADAAETAVAEEDMAVEVDTAVEQIKNHKLEIIGHI